jgi:hypothetical protein
LSVQYNVERVSLCLCWSDILMWAAHSPPTVSSMIYPGQLQIVAFGNLTLSVRAMSLIRSHSKQSEAIGSTA